MASRKGPTDTTEAKWAKRLNAEFKSVQAQIRKSVEVIVTFGKHLKQAKDEIGYGQWGEFVRKSLDVDQDTVAHYIAVASNAVLAESETSRNLPASLEKLYKLSRLPEPVLRAALDRGDVHPDIKLAEIDQLNLRPQTPLKALAQDIAFAACFVSKLDITPALTRLYLSKGSVRAFTGKTGIIWSIPGWTLDETVAVEGKELVRVLNDLVAGGWREVKVAVEGDKLIVQAGTARTVLPLLSADVSPEITAALSMNAPSDGMTLPPEFWEALARVEPVVSKDATRPALCGVYWSESGDLMASDNFRLSVCKTIPCPMPGGLLIPDYFLGLLDRRDFTTLALVDDMIWLLHERGAVYGELLEGAKFPAVGVQRFVTAAREAESTTGITILADPERSIERVVKRNPDQATNRINVTAVDGQLTIAIPDVAEDKVPAQVVGGPVSFIVNGQMFLEALTIGHTFWFASGSPLLFRSDDGRVEHLLTLLEEAQRPEGWEPAPTPKNVMTEFTPEQKRERAIWNSVLAPIRK